MRKNQILNANFLIKFFAMSTVVTILAYLSRYTAEKKEDNEIIKDIFCLRSPKISQICCESGYQRIDDLVACLKGCDNVRFYHNTRQASVSNLNAEVHDDDCLFTCLGQASDGEPTNTIVIDEENIQEFASFCYRRS